MYYMTQNKTTTLEFSASTESEEGKMLTAKFNEKINNLMIMPHGSWRPSSFNLGYDGRNPTITLTFYPTVE